MPREERDDIMLWVNNEESFYNDVQGMYDKWVDEGDAWSERSAHREAGRLIAHIAEAIEASQRYSFPYTAKEISEAVDEVIEDFEQYREEEIAKRQKKAQAKLVERKPMDQEHLEYTRRMDGLLLKVGVSLLPDILDHPINMSADDARKEAIDFFLRFMPASKEKIRHALETGDEHLNTIKLRLWDAQAEKIGRPFMARHRFSLSDVVGLLKHVATWHYA